MFLDIKPLHTYSKLPVRSSSGASGYDLHALHDECLFAKSRVLIRTGIAVRFPELPEPYKVYGSIRSRSGMSVKHGIEVGAGVIDPDYRGEIRVMLYNHSNEDMMIYSGDRIAQLVLEVHIVPDIRVVHTLDETVRGTDGFGSTGQ